MAKTSPRTRKTNNNPEGKNQYSGVSGTVRQNPVKTAGLAAAAVGAGVFLWSRRNQISEQLANLSDQLGEWRDSMATTDETDYAGNGQNQPFIAGKGRGTKTQSEIAEEALTLKQTGATDNVPAA